MGLSGGVELWGAIRSDEEDRNGGSAVRTQVVAEGEAVHLGEYDDGRQTVRPASDHSRAAISAA
jgi:hypothetical protein